MYQHFIEKERAKREDLEHNYYIPMLEKLQNIKEQVALSIGVERNEISSIQTQIDAIKEIVFER